MKNYFKNPKKEPWQIAAARFCVENSEGGFTQDDLNKYIKSIYGAGINNGYLDQFYQEEICEPAGRKYSRSYFKDENNNRRVPPLDLVSKVTDYDELKEARKNSKNAFIFSLIAITISVITLYTTLRLGENQVETSQEQIKLQNSIWNYEQMRNNRLEQRDIEWRREDLQSQNRLL
ncbi:MAG: hypothetical protein Q7S81_03755 [bacterium]|nr:hypothetical protein [bacterium]